MRTSSSPARSTVALAGEEAAPVADVVRAALLPAEAVAAARLRARCLALQREHRQLVAAAALLERVLDFVVERGGVHRLLRAAVLGAQSVRGAEHRAQHAARLVAPRRGEPERLLVVLRDEILDVRLDARDHLVRIDGFLGRWTEAEFARRLREDERGKTGCRKDREALHRSSRIDEVYRVVERRRFSSAQTTAPTFQEPLLILLCFLEHALFLAAHLGRHL